MAPPVLASTRAGLVDVLDIVASHLTMGQLFRLARSSRVFLQTTRESTIWNAHAQKVCRRQRKRSGAAVSPPMSVVRARLREPSARLCKECGARTTRLVKGGRLCRECTQYTPDSVSYFSLVGYADIMKMVQAYGWNARRTGQWVPGMSKIRQRTRALLSQPVHRGANAGHCHLYWHHDVKQMLHLV